MGQRIRVTSIARAALRAQGREPAPAPPSGLTVALVGLAASDAELIERLLRRARGSRYRTLRLERPDDTTSGILRGEIDAILVDGGAGDIPPALGAGSFASAFGVPVLLLVDDWRPGRETALLRAGIADLLEKEELDSERIDRAILFAVARARLAMPQPAVARGDDPWTELRVLLARAVAAHGRRGHGFALVLVDLGAPGVAEETESWQRMRTILVQRLRSRLRRSDVVLEPEPSRLAVLIEDLPNPRDAITVACKLERALLAPLPFANGRDPPAPALAWAVYPVDGTDPDRLLGIAETLLFPGHSAGASPQRFACSALDAVYQRARRLAPAFARALDEGTIELGLQPQTTLRPGPIGLGAVPCWRPTADVALCGSELREVAALVGELDRLTLALAHLAIRQLARWHAEGLRLARLTVPILSRRQLARSDLVERLSASLRESGVPSAALELELQPNQLGHDGAEIGEATAALASSGVRLALRLDRQGPPLPLLARLPLGTVRLAAELLAAAVDDHRQKLLLENLVRLAHGLDLRVVAEDAATPELVGLAREIGCDALQAVTVAPPLPEAEARQWLLRAHRRRPE